MKNKILLSVLFVIFAGSLMAQQKIKDGTAGSNNLPTLDALLELESSNKGLLHSRVALTGTTNATPLTRHVAGMMVYNIAITGDVTPGIYYNDGTKWVSVKSSVTTIVESRPGEKGEPGKPGEAGGPGEGITIVNNDGGTWVYNPTTNQWTAIEDGGNVYYDGDKLTHKDDNGNIQEIIFKELVKANETLTLLVDHGDGAYTYYNESSIDANGDPVAGSGVVINVPASVISEFQTIINSGDVQNILNDYIVNNVGGNVSYDGNDFWYADGAGNLVKIDFSEMVKDHETLTSLSYNDVTNQLSYFDEKGVNKIIDLNVGVLEDNGDGTFTYTNASGDAKVFDANTTELLDNRDGTYTFTNKKGDTVTIDTNADAIAFDNSANGFTSGNVQGALEELASAFGDLEIRDNADGTFSLMGPDGTTVLGTVSKSALSDEGDGLYKFTNNSGTDVEFDIRTVEVAFDATTNIYNFLDADGGTIASIDMNADNVAFDNSGSTLTSTNVEGALKELASAFGDLEIKDNANGTFSLMGPDGTTVLGTVSKSFLSDEGDGLYKFTNNDGSDVTFDVNTVDVAFDATTNIYNFLDADGGTIASIDMNASNVAFNNTASGLTSDDVQSAIDELAGRKGNITSTDLTVTGGANAALTNVTLEITNGAITANKLGAATDGSDEGKVLIANADGTVTYQTALGAIKAAMPKFFYMPAVIFDTSIKGAFTRNLHAEYENQFKGTGNPLLVSSNPSNASTIPTLDKNDLEYHITYYDTTVFSGLAVDADGILTGEIIGGATEVSYMNIVFVVKD